MDVDILKLFRDLLQNKVVSKDANEKLSALDPNQNHLEPEVKVRYLLQQGYARR